MTYDNIMIRLKIFDSKKVLALIKTTIQYVNLANLLTLEHLVVVKERLWQTVMHY